MKKVLRKIKLFAILACLSSTVLAQDEPTWADVILEEKGDTVVVKATTHPPYNYNTMYYAIMLDEDRGNPNRVYETVREHHYIYTKEATIDATVPNINIWAPEGTGVPPLHYKTLDEVGKFNKAFFKLTGASKFTMQNQYIMQGVHQGNSRDRNFFRTLADSCRIEFNNCYVELSNWAWLTGAKSATSIFVNNCLIMNIGNEATIEKGQIYDGKIPLDTLWFENNTMLNCGSFSHLRDGAAPNFTYFNHNTLVNHTNNPFHFFSQYEHIVTNNLFVNTGLAADFPGFYPFFEDADKKPKGIINVDTVDQAWINDHWAGNYPGTEAERKILVHNNSASWDARFTTMFNDSLYPAPEGSGGWNNQMIKMNDRSKAMFDDDTNYPLFNEGDWYSAEPDFANNKDMVAEWIRFIVSNTNPDSVGGGTNQPNWKTNLDTLICTPDWPKLPDLSYTTSELLIGGVNKYPLGDLNWYPSLKASWEETGESDKLIEALKAGTLPVDWDVRGVNDKENGLDVPRQVRAYPNPFTNTTTVSYEIAQNTEAELIVYSMLGKKLKVISLGYKEVGSHETTLERNELNAGMYILQINTNYNKAGLTTKVTVGY